MANFQAVFIPDNTDIFFKNKDDYSSLIKFYERNKDNRILFGIDITDRRNLPILVSRYDRMMSILSCGPKTDKRVTRAIQDITKKYTQIYEGLVEKEPLLSRMVFHNWFSFFKSLLISAFCVFMYVAIFLLSIILAVKLIFWITGTNIELAKINA